MKNGNKSLEYYKMLQTKAKDCLTMDFKNMATGAFTKDETYPIKDGKTKFSRTINAYKDETKYFYGPTFQNIEKFIFSSEHNPIIAKHFVKKVPVRDRPALIEDTFLDREVCVADFSSFECHHRGIMARIIAKTIMHVAGDSLTPEVRQMFATHVLLTNMIRFRTGVSAEVEQTLMSGAVWTSLSNCLLSHYIVSYLRLKNQHMLVPGKLLHIFYDEFVGFCEGDDSITLGGAYNPMLSQALGISMKSVVHADCSTSEFCGILKPLGVDATLTDPVKVICNFFQLSMKDALRNNRKQKALMRAKAYSYYYQYATCPVIAHLAFAVLKKTAGCLCDPSALSYVRKYVYDEAADSDNPEPKFYKIPPNINMSTRVLFDQLYSWSVDEQLSFEASIMRWADGSDEVPPLPLHLFYDYTLHSYFHTSRCDHLQRPTVWNPDSPLPDPTPMVGMGVFSARKFIDIRPESADEIERCCTYELDGKKIRYKFFQSWRKVLPMPAPDGRLEMSKPN